MEPSVSSLDVKTWLLERVGKLIDANITRQSTDARPSQIIWKGCAKVVRCVDVGVVLALKAGGGSWWNRIFGNVTVKNVAPRWLQKPVSIPYDDLSIAIDPTTGGRCLIIDAATFQRSPEDLMKQTNREQTPE